MFKLQLLLLLLPTCALSTAPCKEVIPLREYERTIGWYATDAVLNSAQCGRHVPAEFCAGAYRLFGHVTGACYREGFTEYVVQVEVTESTCPIDQPVPACNEQPSGPGFCRAHMPRWSYDAHAGECVRFVYGGCGGNDNRFTTKAECEAESAAAAVEPVVYACCLPPFADGHYDEETGENWHCLAYMPSWSYVPDLGRCVRFIYGGCGGNSNRFGSKAECEAECAAAEVEPAEDVCDLPPFADGWYDEESGQDFHCHAYMPGWSYVPDLARCVRFIYGGCGGNDNRFGSQDDCEAKCAASGDHSETAPGHVCGPRAGGKRFTCSITAVHEYASGWRFDTEPPRCEMIGGGGTGGSDFGKEEALDQLQMADAITEEKL